MVANLVTNVLFILNPRKTGPYLRYEVSHLLTSAEKAKEEIDYNLVYSTSEVESVGVGKRISPEENTGSVNELQDVKTEQ